MTQLAPVVLIIFNRPETTARVFAEIRQARPAQLFIIADGPRPDIAEDAERCAVTRQVVADVDWPCTVQRLYAETNLGCGLRPASGISWVFEQVEEAIILEDDCLPDPSFFRYCSELLKRYRHDPQVMHIAGHNRGFIQHPATDSYYFSLLPYCWGWASWRRAWQHFDYTLSRWPEVNAADLLRTRLPDDATVRFWSRRFADVHQSQRRDIWDFQWNFACWINDGVAIVPNVTLVKNIGFGPSATHTRDAEEKLVNMTANAMCFPLVHPQFCRIDEAVDRRAFREFQRGRMALLVDRLRSVFGKSA